jgi:stringent starvation protein B
MSNPFGEDASSNKVPSTKPYLIRALYQWCVDNAFTPYVSVFVDRSVDVPREYVNKDEIVLNIGPTACQSIEIDNDSIQFKARFNGIPKEIYIPITHVMAIYSRENSQGMSFPVNISQSEESNETNDSEANLKETTKSHIKLVK